VAAGPQRAQGVDHVLRGGNIVEHLDHDAVRLHRQQLAAAREQLARKMDVHGQATRQPIQADLQRGIRYHSQRGASGVRDHRIQRRGGFAVEQLVGHHRHRRVVHRLAGHHGERVGGPFGLPPGLPARLVALVRSHDSSFGIGAPNLVESGGWGGGRRRIPANALFFGG
jgi:hypothetical protein